MKKRMLTVLTVLLACCFVFAGCGAENVSRVYTRDEEKTFEISSFTDITTNLSEADFEGSVTDRGNVVVSKLVGADLNYGVFSILENKYVVNLAKVDSIEVEETEAADYAIIETTTSGVTTYKVTQLNGSDIYTDLKEVSLSTSYKLGEAVFEVWSVQPANVEVAHLEYVKIANGVRTVVYDTKLEMGENLNSLKAEPAIEYGKDNLLLETFTGDNGYRNFKVINTEDNEVVAEYSLYLPEIINTVYIGDYMIYQTRKEVDAYSNDYTYMDGGVKYQLETRKINLLDGKDKKIRTKYLIEDDVSFAEFGNDFTIVKVQMIEDKQLQYASSAVLTVDGKVELLDHTYSNISKLNDNRFYAIKGYKKHIIDAQFNVVVDLSDYEVQEINASFAVIERADKLAMVDLDGKLLTAFEYENIYATSNNAVIMNKDVKDTTTNKITRTYYSVSATGVATAIAVVEDFAGALPTYKVGNDTDVKYVGFVAGMMYATKTSATTGNTVYNFYNATGANVASLDVKTGLVQAYTYGEFGEHIYLIIGSNFYAVC